MAQTKARAPRNRTLTLTSAEYQEHAAKLLIPSSKLTVSDIENQIINSDFFKVIDLLPDNFIDLLIIDPPYNLTRNFNGNNFSQRSDQAYTDYLESWFPKLIRCLKDNASVYLCCDWKSSAPCYNVISKYLNVINRITWQREKGRGAKTNWKNCCEDIFFAVKGDNYTFNLDAVKVRKKVIAPYRENGSPKDWEETSEGNYRYTCPSNFWDDISIPYWSMPENTDHPTQKPEKLLAKLILASSNENDLVFDPFLGSGSTAVTAKKLNRKFSGIELNEEYCTWTMERLKRADLDKTIQGYKDGIFYERNAKIK